MSRPCSEPFRLETSWVNDSVCLLVTTNNKKSELKATGLETCPTPRAARSMSRGAVNSESGTQPMEPPFAAVEESSECALAKAAKLAPFSSWRRKETAVALELTSMTETQASLHRFGLRSTKAPSVPDSSEVPARLAARASSSTWNLTSWER